MTVFPSTCQLVTAKTWAVLTDTSVVSNQHLLRRLQCNFIIVKHRSKDDNKHIFDKQIRDKQQFNDVAKQLIDVMNMNLALNPR